MHDRREERFTVGGIDGDDRVPSVWRAKHDELGAAVRLPAEEEAGNAMLRHWAVIALDADPAVGKRDDVEPVLHQWADGSCGGRGQTGRCKHKTLAPRRLRIRAAYRRRGSPSRGP